ncbi:LAGLIDADG family homing endonuclease [Geobacillus stearothermophilus]|nr:LAGLIDADG family homing endonuclease [Geobacillus stearothermophilus]
MVVCGVCGKIMKMLNNAHLDTHGLTPKEYDETYPDFPRYDVEVRKGMGKETTVKHDLFDEFNYENAWLLGLLTADGSFSGKSHPNLVQLYNTDRGLVEAFKRISQSDRKIMERHGVRGQLGKKIVYHFAISSLPIVERLKELNAYGDKDQRNPFNNIPNKYKWAFIKGLFDGDGNFYRGMISIAGRRRLIKEVYKWICEQINKEPNKLYKCSSTDITVYFQLCKSDSERVYRLMEKHSPGTHNSRKYKKMQAYFEVDDGLGIFKL